MQITTWFCKRMKKDGNQGATVGEIPKIPKPQVQIPKFIHKFMNPDLELMNYVVDTYLWVHQLICSSVLTHPIEHYLLISSGRVMARILRDSIVVVAP
jgi:hypothetical protein